VGSERVEDTYGDEKAETQGSGGRISAQRIPEGSEEDREGQEDLSWQVARRVARELRHARRAARCSPGWWQQMTSHEEREETRKNALTAFLETRVNEGYRIETRTDTHAIIAPASPGRSLLGRFRAPKPDARQVVEVDVDGVVTMTPAEPLRS
jgi:hypothetical protein